MAGTVAVLLAACMVMVAAADTSRSLLGGPTCDCDLDGCFTYTCKGDGKVTVRVKDGGNCPNWKKIVVIQDGSKCLKDLEPCKSRYSDTCEFEADCDGKYHFSVKLDRSSCDTMDRCLVGAASLLRTRTPATCPASFPSCKDKSKTWCLYPKTGCWTPNCPSGDECTKGKCLVGAFDKCVCKNYKAEVSKCPTSPCICQEPTCNSQTGKCGLKYKSKLTSQEEVQKCVCDPSCQCLDSKPY